ncbi:MAG: hypothetical protein ACR2KJ_00105 [Jatrophihabitans sp.]
MLEGVVLGADDVLELPFPPEVFEPDVDASLMPAPTTDCPRFVSAPASVSS